MKMETIQEEEEELILVTLRGSDDEAQEIEARVKLGFITSCQIFLTSIVAFLEFIRLMKAGIDIIVC